MTATDASGHGGHGGRVHREVRYRKVLSRNRLAGEASVADWIVEGPLAFADGPDDGGGAVGDRGVVLRHTADEAEVGDHAHGTVWCPVPFPDRIEVRWEFRPIAEPGLAMLFFAATGRADRELGGGRVVDLFSPELPARTGHYPQYHSGPMDALHLSYFRHKFASELAFRTCNLRKSHGFELVAQGADPLPPAEHARGFYAMRLVKDGPLVTFSIDGLEVLRWVDPGETPVRGGGYLGFRQMAPLVAEYRDLEVRALP